MAKKMNGPAKRRAKLIAKSKKFKPRADTLALRGQKVKKNGGLAAAVNIPRSVPRGPGNARKMDHMEQLCSVTDPFCYKARNSKWPDGLGAGTMTLQVRSHQGMQVLGTAGVGIGYFSAALPFNGYQASSQSGGAGATYTFPAANAEVGGDANFKLFTQNFRVVSWGAIIRNILPALTAQGFMSVSKVNTAPALSSTSELVGTTYGSEVQTVPLQAGTQVTVIGRPIGVEARQFVPQSTSTSVLTGTGWDIIKVEIFGGPATNNLVCLDVEFVYNVEIQVTDVYTPMLQMAPPNAPNKPQVVKASTDVFQNIGTIIEGGVEQVGAKVVKSAGSAIENMLKEGLEWGLAALTL
jgi:hypothetical protein